MNYTQVIAMINGILAWCASISLFWAAFEVSNRLRHVLFVEACLAMFYSVAYWWLAFNLELAREWSEILRWIGIVSWPVAWIASPIMLIYWLRGQGKKLQENARRVVEETVGGPGP